ncbi:MAG TPA: DUF6152 family protein [Gammaproteobacteria bacterium]
MKRKIFAAITASVLPLAAAVPAFAHHSAYAFDTERTLVLEGVVTEWFWANPHCLLKFDVETDGGEIVEWVTETQAPANMIDAGWRKNDLRPGDEVTVTVQPARNGNPVGRIVLVEFADGRILDATQDRSGATGSEYHLSGAPPD